MGLHVEIYRDLNMGGCSAHGVSDIQTRPEVRGVTIIGIDAPHEPSKEYPAACLIAEKHFKHPTVRVVPLELLEQNAWAMMGGSYVATSDSRFNEAIEQLTGHTFYGAVALHDRTESASYIRSMD